MNKILTKVATLALGAAMAVAVGVAVCSKKVSAAHADPVTVNFSSGNAGSWSSTAGSQTGTVDGITVACTNGIDNGSQLRFYAKSTITISSTVGNITNVTFTATQGTITGQSEGSVSGLVWTGESSSFTLTVGTQIRSTNVAIQYSPSGPVTSYTITYDANGGTGTMEDTTNTVADCTFTAPSGKEFSSWNTVADGSGTPFAAGATVTSDTDLFAIWQDISTSETGTINFGSASGSLNVNSTSVSGDDSLSNTWTVETTFGGSTSFTPNASYAQIGSSSKPASSINFNMSLSEEKVIKNFSAKFGGFSGTAGTVVLKVDGTSVGTGSLNATNDVIVSASTSNVEGTDLSIEVSNISKGVKVYYVSYEIEDKSVDPDKQTLQINANGTDYDSATMNYSIGSALFYAKDEDNNDVTVASSWAISDPSIATLALNGNGIPYVTFVKGGTVTITATHPDYNAGTFSLTINVGELSTIVVSSNMSKTSYYVGETWNPAGLTVTANYEYGYHGDVTSEVTWSYDPAAPAVNVNSVVATASFGGKSASSSSQSVSVSRTNPIQVLYTKASGDSVDVYGYYVGFLDGTGPVIMDGEYGIVVYNKSADVSGYTVNETILHVTGSVSIYKGLYEIGTPSISEASGTYDAPDTPVIYSTTGNETADYASRLTTVTGTATLTSGSFDDAAGTNDIKLSFTVGTKTVQVFYKKAAQTADADAFAAIKDAVANSTEITIKGFTGWYDGFQVQMNGVVEAAESYTAEEFAQYLLDETDAVCEGYVEGDNNYEALVTVWNKLQNPTDPDQKSYPFLPAAEKTILGEADADEEGSTIEQAIARYEHICSAYGLAQFIEGRAEIPVKGTYAPSYMSTLDSSSSITIIVIVAVASMTLLGVTLVLRKRKMN